MTATGEFLLADLLPGFSGALLLTRGGRPVLREAVGIADAGTEKPVTPETIFQICSVGKQFAAAAVLLLCEDGELDLRTPIGRWLPEAPATWDRITLHHLISNTSGLGHWEVVPDLNWEQRPSPEQYLARLAKRPLLFAPGTAWGYSSPGFLVAAEIVERVTTETYREFTTRRIFAPLGMTATSSSVPVGPSARGHAGEDSRRRATTAYAPMPGAGDADGTLITEGYGYGYVVGTLAGRAVRFHFGDNPGFQTFQLRVPELDVDLVILSNHEETDVNDVCHKILTYAREVFE
jgi:CubicO group peptidase (beta-lactamase class C family)